MWESKGCWGSGGPKVVGLGLVGFKGWWGSRGQGSRGGGGQGYVVVQGWWGVQKVVGGTEGGGGPCVVGSRVSGDPGVVSGV